MVIIKMDNIYKNYRLGKVEIPALRGIDLELEHGEMVCLQGPSGSGKTTLLNMISGIDAPDQGRVLVNAQHLSTLKDGELSEFRNRTLGFVFQHYNLIPVLSVYENIEYPLILQGVKKKERRDRVERMMQAVGLSNFRKHKPDELSGGQRQRVAIGRALITNPKIVIADEPTASLDHETGSMIMELMKEMNRELKTTFIFATHDNLVATYAARIIMMRDGRITQNTLVS